MEDKEKEDRQRQRQDDYLSDVSRQFASKEQERDFIESIGPEPAASGSQASMGERVKRVREGRDLSIRDVSQRTGLDPDYLEKVESGEVAAPLGTVIRLAKALEMKMGYFISGEEERPFTIVRHDDRKVVARYDAKRAKHYGYGYESLAPHKTDRHMEPFQVTLEPSEAEEERSTHDGQEFIYVLEGAMEVRLGGEVYVLSAGDAIYYDSTVPHLVKCHGDQKTRLLAVLYTEK